MSTPGLPRDFEIARKVGHVTETCNYGCEHQVDYVESIFVSPTGETREHDNGYEKRQTSLAADRRGRIYHQHVTIDFSNNVSWVRNEDGARFTTRPSSNPERLLSGHGVKNCPDGPAWKDAVAPVVTNQTEVEKALRALGLDATPENIARILAMKDEQEGDA